MPAAGSLHPQRLLVVMPTWLGDCVMATPTLAALRGLYPQARITALLRDSIAPVLAGLPSVDATIGMNPGPRTGRRGDGDGGGRLLPLARRLRRERFDLAVLLPNSFRTGLMVRLAGIPRRVGYGRDGRSLLLTDALIPRHEGSYIPVPTREYYLGLVRYLGAREVDPTMHLVVREADDRAATGLLADAGLDPGDGRPLVLLNPGAAFGAAKMWPPARFAAVADRCAGELGAVVALIGAPSERPVLAAVKAAARTPLLDLPAYGLDLATLKAVIARARVLVTNDTGPRHVAAALDTPVVTIFGPTDPAWTEIGYARERIVRVDVPCGPCQLKVCPLDHRCMTRVHPGRVVANVAELMSLPVRASA
ncbi:MAG: lipopolysaccharide heptosyltransferase II [Phycisphaeraceae bacterium]